MGNYDHKKGKNKYYQVFNTLNTQIKLNTPFVSCYLSHYVIIQELKK